MRKLFEWNIAFNFVMEIKDKYEIIFGEEKDYNCKDGLTTLEFWINKINNERYNKVAKLLQFSQNGNLILLRYANYSKLFSEEIDFDSIWEVEDGLLLECRSLVIDLKEENIVLCPFKKFRNLNEGKENSLENIQNKIRETKNIEISDKLDGSMQSVSFYQNQFIMSGSQSLNSEDSWRLKDGFGLLNDSLDIQEMVKSLDNHTFVFEYIKLIDAHVVVYTKEQEGLYLIGIRNNLTGKQFSYQEVKKIGKFYNVETPELYEFDFDTMMSKLNEYKSYEKEGYVLNIDGHMLKVKCDDYVQIHKMLSALSSINLIIKNIADNTIDDLLGKIPSQYKQRTEKIIGLINNYIKETDKAVKEYFEKAPKNDKKEFMLWIEQEVPNNIRGYVRSLFLGVEVNYLKGGKGNCPHYKKLKDMGINEDYSLIFNEENE